MLKIQFRWRTLWWITDYNWFGWKSKRCYSGTPTYGVLKAELNVSTNRDLKKFMEKATTNEFKQLSVLSPDYHIHTIEVSDEDVFEEIKKELRDKNILFE